MTIRSYPLDNALGLAQRVPTPIHLGSVGQRVYYAFAPQVPIPKGGKTVTASTLATVRANSPLIRQIKSEAQRRITAIAPLWKQHNALYDAMVLGQQSTLNKREQQRLDQAQALLSAMGRLRACSNNIEASFLNGVAMDYLNDGPWQGG